MHKVNSNAMRNKIAFRKASAALIATFQKKRNIYAYIIGACVLVMIIYSFIEPKTYTAEATLYQRQFSFLDESSLGGLSSFFGASATQTPIDHFALVMTSRPVAKLMIERQGLDKILFASRWNEKEHAWRPAPGLKPAIRRLIHVIFGLPAWRPPDDADLARLIKSSVDITSSDVDGTITLRYRSRDPKVAALVLSALYEDTTAIIQQDQTAALNRIYSIVSHQLNDTNNVGLRGSMSDLASQSLLSIVKADAKSVEIGMLNPVRVDPIPTSPRPVLNVFVGILIGVLIIVGWRLYSLVKWMIRSRLEAA